MLGGADADLLLDDLLVDVKTTATLKIRTEDWRQLIAYAALNEHFPIGGGERPMAIRRVGFYFSRYGYLASWPLAELVDPVKFTGFAAWLRDYATEAHVRRTARRIAARAALARNVAEWQQRQHSCKAKRDGPMRASRRQAVKTEPAKARARTSKRKRVARKR